MAASEVSERWRAENARLSALVMEARTSPPSALSYQLDQVLYDLTGVVGKAPKEGNGDLATLTKSLTLAQLHHTVELTQKAMHGLKLVEDECQWKLQELVKQCGCPAMAVPGLGEAVPSAWRRAETVAFTNPTQPAVQDTHAQNLDNLVQAAAQVVAAAAVTERAVAAATRLGPLGAGMPDALTCSAVAAAARAAATVSAATWAAEGRMLGPAARPPPPPAEAKFAVPNSSSTAPAAESRQCEEALQPVRDMLQYHQTALLNEDPKCIIIVQQITRLGQRSREVLRIHYSQYGKVSKVLIANSMAKPSRGSSNQQNTRSGALGFIVMASCEGAERALAAGDEQVVAGCRVHVERFNTPEEDATGKRPPHPGSDKSNGSLGSQEEGSLDRSELADTGSGSGSSDTSCGAGQGQSGDWGLSADR